jgi:uncharacterized protein YmfQ (DUF2313 family)
MPTKEQFKEALHKLFPQGPLKPSPAEDSILDGVLEVGANALQDAEEFMRTNLRESFPDQTGDYLEDWETELGLPPPGVLIDDTGANGLTREQRKNLVLAWLNTSPYSNKQFLVDIAAIAGFTITIEDRNDDPTLGDNEFRVSGTVETLQYFQAGINAVGDDLAIGNLPLENLIIFFKQAHTIPIFEYT